MQITKLHIAEYKLLKDFTIDFKKDVSILIGINGSGKSTILEAIAIIFSEVYLGKKSSFAFSIEYELFYSELSFGSPNINLKNVAIKAALASDKKGGQIQGQTIGMNKEGEEAIKEYVFPHIQAIRPNNIVIYYSGLSEIMKEICKPHNEHLSRQLREGNQNTKNPFLYFEPAMFDIILLSLLSYQYGDVPTFLLKRVKIDYLQSVSIRLKKPPRDTPKTTDWWGAKGEVKNFLDYLNTLGKPLIIDEKSTTDKSTGNIVIEIIDDKAIIITIIAQEKLFEIREHYVEEKKLFQILNTLYYDGFLDGMEFNFYNEAGDSFSILSEGEQQAIIVKGLTELAGEENTLFLFDEPDTYLHPSWQKDFIDEISTFNEVNANLKNEFIITTHSPQMVNSIKEGELIIMRDGKVVEHTNDFYGRDINSILEYYMEAESRPEETMDIIEKVTSLINEKKYKEAKVALEKLNKNDVEYIRLSTKLKFIMS